MPSIPYPAALKEIHALEKFGSQLGLERITRLLSLLGNPQNNYKCIIVGGTNGKGSTVEFLGSILSSTGSRVGTYFSPQIEEFPERIRINRKNAGEKEIADAYLQVKQICAENKIEATFFEVITAMALLIFKMRKVDFAVLEVGLGGRLDAVNAVEPELSAITSISLEHTNVLGSTVEQIAHEKCGIARKGKPLVCGTVGPVEKTAILSECKAMGARCGVKPDAAQSLPLGALPHHAGAKPVFIQEEVKVSKLTEKSGKYSFHASFSGKPYSVSLSAPGRFQVSNACVALACASILGASKKAVEQGLQGTVPKFRLQKISSAPAIFADCCHNPGAAFALASELRHMPGKKILLFSAMKDKDYRQVLDILKPFFQKIVLTEVSLERAARLSELQSAAASIRADAIAVKNPVSAFASAKKLAGKGGTIVIAGSIYLLGELFGRDKIRMAQ